MPILAPFSPSGKIDKTNLLRHLELLERSGVRQVLVNGTTGEFFSLLPEERKEVYKLVRDHFGGNVLFQAGSDSLAMTTQQANWAQDNGADGVMVLPPYYMAKVPAEGLIEYFNCIAAKMRIPLILYNFPKHTQNPLTADILARIDHFGIKDSSGDLSLISATKKYYIGGDDKILTAHNAGAYGFVSARANALPELYSKMDHAIINKNLEEAGQIQAVISTVKKHMSGANGIAIIKYTLANKLANYPLTMRCPLVGIDDTQREALDNFLNGFRY